MTRPTAAKPNFCVFPVAIVCDTRERLLYSFQGLRTDARDGSRPLIVTLKAGTLGAGDYSLEGFEQQIACERKSLSDLFGTLGQGRARFQRELERLNEYEAAYVIIEAGWDKIINSPPSRTRLLPKVVHRSILHWTLKYRGIHWLTCTDRRFAEITTFRILEAFYRKRTANAKRPKLPQETLLGSHPEDGELLALDGQHEPERLRDIPDQG